MIILLWTESFSLLLLKLKIFFLSMKKFFLFYFLFALHSLKSGITISKLVNKSTTTLTNTIQWYMFCFHMKTCVLIFGVKFLFDFFQFDCVWKIDLHVFTCGQCWPVDHCGEDGNPHQPVRNSQSRFHP